MPDDKLIALEEALSALNDAGALLQDLESVLAQARSKYEEAVQAVEAMRDPIEVETADDFAQEHDDDEADDFDFPEDQ